MPIGVMSVEDMDITINQSVADELGITIGVHAAVRKVSTRFRFYNGRNHP